MSRDEILAELRRAGELIEQRVVPDGSYGGWNGRDLLLHLGAYTRLVGAMLRGAAEGRQPGQAELFGRDLTPAEAAMTDLDQINHAVIEEYAHLSYEDARALWRQLHQDALEQIARLSEQRLSAPGPDYAPQWWRPHLSEVVTTLTAHYDAHLSGASH